jgi:hypothetical protein
LYGTVQEQLGKMVNSIHSICIIIYIICPAGSFQNKRNTQQISTCGQGHLLVIEARLVIFVYKGLRGEDVIILSAACDMLAHMVKSGN